MQQNSQDQEYIGDGVSDRIKIRIDEVLDCLEFNEVRPKWPLDRGVIYDLGIAAVAAQIGYEANRYANGFERPLLRDTPEIPMENLTPVEAAILSGFLERLLQDSDPNGRPFDVEFALKVLGIGFNEQVLEWVRTGETVPRDDSFESWLAGFSVTDE